MLPTEFNVLNYRMLLVIDTFQWLSENFLYTVSTREINLGAVQSHRNAENYKTKREK